VITFNFASTFDFTSMTLYFDDADGTGGVSQPGQINVNATPYGIPDNPGPAPFSVTLNLSVLAATNQLSVEIFTTNDWVFLSEVTFEGRPAIVPLPATGLLLLGGLAGLSALRRRKATAGQSGQAAFPRQTVQAGGGPPRPAFVMSGARSCNRGRCDSNFERPTQTLP